MTTKTKAAPAAAAGPHSLVKLRQQYGCGPVELTGSDHALYERHLMFDDVVKPAAAGPRERFEAVARSVRDVLDKRIADDAVQQIRQKVEGIQKYPDLDLFGEFR